MVNTKENKFRGGAWIGSWQITWPFVTLEVCQDELILNNQLFRKKYCFTHDQIEKIEIKKYLPIVAHGICIIPRDTSSEDKYYFWYLSFKFNNLTNVLKEFGWL